jgi:mycofactocin biosynthesis protein MftB
MDLSRAWRLHPKVALRDESFGALAYHYDTRRLLFLKSRPLVELVSSLQDFASADAALAALIPEGERARYGRALARLAASEVIDVA